MHQAITHPGVSKELQTQYAGTYHDKQGVLLLVASGEPILLPKNSSARLAIPAFVSGFKSIASENIREKLRLGICAAQEAVVACLGAQLVYGKLGMAALHEPLRRT